MLSAHLQCNSCYAAFDYFGESAGLIGQVCSLCGSNLIELPDTAGSEPEGIGLQMTRPPFSEMNYQAATQLVPSSMPRLVRQGDKNLAVIRRPDLVSLAGDVDLHVEVWPVGHRTSAAIAQWGASLLELDVGYTEMSLDATLVGLTDQVSARVTQLLGQDDEERESRLPLLLKLWLEDQAGHLGTLLEEAAVLVNWEYERDAR